MLNFVEPAGVPSFISTVQRLWPLYVRLTGSRLHVELPQPDEQILRALEGQSAIICPNHADPDDPYALFAISAQCKQQFAYLSAREIFKKAHSASAIWLQLLGCYSVVRGAADIEAYKATLELLVNQHARVVIFPEGEITHQNMHVIELESGAEQIALSAALKMAESRPGTPIQIVPLGLLYRYVSPITEPANEALLRIEHELHVSRPACMCVPHRLRACFVELLQRFGNEQWKGSSWNLDEVRDAVIEQRLQAIAAKHHVRLLEDLRPVQKIHQLKNVFCEKRFAKRAKKVSLQDRRQYRALKNLTNWFAIGEHSFDHSLSQEEFAELLFGLEQELFKRSSIKIGRVCHVAVEQPFDAEQFIPEFKNNRESAVRACKSLLAQKLAQAVNALAVLHPSLVTYPICNDHLSGSGKITPADPSLG